MRSRGRLPPLWGRQGRPVLRQTSGPPPHQAHPLPAPQPGGGDAQEGSLCNPRFVKHSTASSAAPTRSSVVTPRTPSRPSGGTWRMCGRRSRRRSDDPVLIDQVLIGECGRGPQGTDERTESKFAHVPFSVATRRKSPHTQLRHMWRGRQRRGVRTVAACPHSSPRPRDAFAGRSRRTPGSYAMGQASRWRRQPTRPGFTGGTGRKSRRAR